MRTLALPLLAVAVAAAAAGCGGSKSHGAPPTSTATAQATTAATGTTSGAAALRAEAASAATGDIPDNQVFVVFADAAARYAVKYPEGWAQSGGGRRVVMRDKNNIIRIVVRNGGAGVAAATRELRSPGVRLVRPPRTQSLPSGTAVKAVYSTQSAPNPVTGKRVTLLVDRYYLRHDGRVAVVDLGTPVGVDNVDAYRLIIQSFRWR